MDPHASLGTLNIHTVQQWSCHEVSSWIRAVLKARFPKALLPSQVLDEIEQSVVHHFIDGQTILKLKDGDWNKFLPQHGLQAAVQEQLALVGENQRRKSTLFNSGAGIKHGLVGGATPLDIVSVNVEPTYRMLGKSQFSNQPVLDKPFVKQEGWTCFSVRYHRMKWLLPKLVFYSKVMFSLLTFLDWIVVALYVGVGYGCYWRGFQINFSPSLFVAGIIFPLSLAVNSAFQRREKALQELGQLRSSCYALYLCHASWCTSVGGGSTDCRARFHRLFNTITMYLQAADETAKAKYLCGIYAMFGKLHAIHEELRTAKRVEPPLLTRPFHTLQVLMEGFERLRVVSDYRTPSSIRVFTRLSIILGAFVFGPYFSYLGFTYTHWAIFDGGVALSLLFLCLLNVQQMLEYPFHSVGLSDFDHINLDSMHAPGSVSMSSYSAPKLSIASDSRMVGTETKHATPSTPTALTPETRERARGESEKSYTPVTADHHHMSDEDDETNKSTQQATKAEIATLTNNAGDNSHEEERVHNDSTNSNEPPPDLVLQPPTLTSLSNYKFPPSDSKSSSSSQQSGAKQDRAKNTLQRHDVIKEQTSESSLSLPALLPVEEEDEENCLIVEDNVVRNDSVAGPTYLHHHRPSLPCDPTPDTITSPSVPTAPKDVSSEVHQHTDCAVQNVPPMEPTTVPSNLVDGRFNVSGTTPARCVLHDEHSIPRDSTTKQQQQPHTYTPSSNTDIVNNIYKPSTVGIPRDAMKATNRVTFQGGVVATESSSIRASVPTLTPETASSGKHEPVVATATSGGSISMMTPRQHYYYKPPSLPTNAEGEEGVQHQQLSPQTITSQPFCVHFDGDDCLPQNSPFILMKDSDGNVWLRPIPTATINNAPVLPLTSQNITSPPTSIVPQNTGTASTKASETNNSHRPLLHPGVVRLSVLKAKERHQQNTESGEPLPITTSSTQQQEGADGDEEAASTLTSAYILAQQQLRDKFTPTLNLNVQHERPLNSSAVISSVPNQPKTSKPNTQDGGGGNDGPPETTTTISTTTTNPAPTSIQTTTLDIMPSLDDNNNKRTSLGGMSSEYVSHFINNTTNRKNSWSTTNNSSGSAQLLHTTSAPSAPMKYQHHHPVQVGGLAAVSGNKGATTPSSSTAGGGTTDEGRSGGEGKKRECRVGRKKSPSLLKRVVASRSTVKTDKKEKKDFFGQVMTNSNKSSIHDIVNSIMCSPDALIHPAQLQLLHNTQFLVKEDTAASAPTSKPCYSSCSDGEVGDEVDVARRPLSEGAGGGWIVDMYRTDSNKSESSRRKKHRHKRKLASGRSNKDSEGSPSGADEHHKLSADDGK